MGGKPSTTSVDSQSQHRVVGAVGHAEMECYLESPTLAGR